MTAPAPMQIPGFRGDVIAPDHEGYDDARTVWNGAVDRRPRLIARCRGTADVAAAVRFARDRDLEIAVRGGGHNVAGTATCDDGIVIDLSAMRTVTVDPLERTAAATSAVPLQRAISRGRRSTVPFHTARASSYPSWPRAITSPRNWGIWIAVGAVIVPPLVDGLIAASGGTEEKSAIWTSK